MTRVPVPDDYERGHVSVAGAIDYHYGEADVNLDGVDRARDLTVVEDDDGRYIGAPEWCADAVADYLGVTLSDDDAETDADSEDDDAETCQAVKTDGEVCGRDLPCPYHSDGGEGNE